MMSNLYLAYGSNLSVEQMLYRCPGAVYIGATDLPGTRLMFRGSKTGSYLSIEPALPKHPRSVPCLVWRISRENEHALDRYEGYPDFYAKEIYRDLTLRALDGPGSDIRVFDGMAYQLPVDSPAGAPSYGYFRVCELGYRHFGFPVTVLRQALIDSIGAPAAREYLDQYFRQQFSLE